VVGVRDESEALIFFKKKAAGKRCGRAGRARSPQRALPKPVQKAMCPPGPELQVSHMHMYVCVCVCIYIRTTTPKLN